MVYELFEWSTSTTEHLYENSFLVKIIFWIAFSDFCLVIFSTGVNIYRYLKNNAVLCPTSRAPTREVTLK